MKLEDKQHQLVVVIVHKGYPCEFANRNDIGYIPLGVCLDHIRRILHENIRVHHLKKKMFFNKIFYLLIDFSNLNQLKKIIIYYTYF